MTPDEAEIELSVVRQMLEQSALSALNVLHYLYLWAFLGLGAAAVSEALLFRGLPDLIPRVWFVETAIGCLATAWLRRREVRRVRVVTALERVFFRAWAAIWVTDFVVIALMLAGAPIHGETFFFLAGLGLFASGAVAGSWEAYFSAALWWLGGALALVFPQQSFLILSGLFLVAFVIPIHLFVIRHRNRVATGAGAASQTDEIAAPNPAFSVGDILDLHSESTGHFWMFLAIWGGVGSVLELTSHLLAREGRYEDIKTLWSVGCFFGVALIVFLGSRAQAHRRSFIVGALFNTWLGVLLTLFSMLLVSRMLEVDLTRGAFALIIASGLSMTGALLRWRSFYVAAALFWFGGCFILFWPAGQFLLGAGLMLGGEVYPALTLRAAEQAS
jgi:hypothetical protein